MLQREDPAVIGAGAMGTGFAVHFVLQDRSVALVDHRESNLERAAERIADITMTLREHGKTDLTPEEVLDEITLTVDRESAVRDRGIVLETISEDLEAKQALFASLSDQTSDDTILASNTSGIPITDIAAGAPDAAERILGCHWWYPPYLLPPVEIIRGEETDERFFEEAVSFVESVDRVPIRVNHDVPGFVFNRIQHALVRECLHLAEAGIASIEDINEGIKKGYAIRTAAIGPIETLDLAGLDLVETVSEELYPHLATDEDASELLSEHVESGRTGVEAGEGFFAYDESFDDVSDRRDARILAVLDALERSE